MKLTGQYDINGGVFIPFPVPILVTEIDGVLKDDDGFVLAVKDDDGDWVDPAFMGLGLKSKMIIDD